MTIQDLKNLDLYKCSLQDINKAERVLGKYVDKLIENGFTSDANFKVTQRYSEAKKLHVLISRAQAGMTAQGEMMEYNTKKERLPNSKSIL